MAFRSLQQLETISTNQTRSLQNLDNHCSILLDSQISGHDLIQDLNLQIRKSESSNTQMNQYQLSEEQRILDLEKNIQIERNITDNLQKLQKIRKIMNILENIYIEKIIVVIYILVRIGFQIYFLDLVIQKNIKPSAQQVQVFLIALISLLILKELLSLIISCSLVYSSYNNHYIFLKQKWSDWQQVKQNISPKKNSFYIQPSMLTFLNSFADEFSSISSNFYYRKCMIFYYTKWFKYLNIAQSVYQTAIYTVFCIALIKYDGILIGKDQLIYIIILPQVLISEILLIFMTEFYLVQFLVAPIIIVILIIFLEVKKMITEKKDISMCIKEKATYITPESENYPKDVQDCAICLEDLQENTNEGGIIQFPCHISHIFHTHCAKNWYNQKSIKQCPICKRIFTANQFFGPHNSDVIERESRFANVKKQCNELLYEFIPSLVQRLKQYLIKHVVFLSSS